MLTAIYLRVSTPDQKVAMQRTELGRYCKQRGWKNLRFYEDTASGAKATRKELERLMLDARGGRIERILAYKLDRLGRSLPHLALIIGELHRLRVALVCPSQGIDTSDDNPAGALQRNILMAVAEFERSLIQERTRDGLAAAKGRGITLGRPRLNAGIAQAIRKLRKAGLSFPAIARKLKVGVGTAHRLAAKKV